MMITRVSRLTTLLAAVVIAAACASPTEPAAPSAPTEDASGGEATDAVTYRNIRVEPADIEVAVGTTVTWTNADIVRHTVTSGEPGAPDGAFDETLEGEGDTVSVTFDEPGVVAYFCDLHRAMVGTVTVTG